VRLDVEDVAGRERALREIRAYTGTDSFDSVICSHILNYVDFRATIDWLHGIQAPGGRLIIFNQPFEGEAELFSPGGASDNAELLQFLRREDYAIEFLQAAPWINVNDYDGPVSSKTLLIVARS